MIWIKSPQRRHRPCIRAEASKGPACQTLRGRCCGTAYRKMKQNLWWAAGYNLIAVPLAAGVLAPIGFVMPMAVGALLMSLSTVVVAMNAQLLRRLDLAPETSVRAAHGARPVHAERVTQ